MVLFLKLRWFFCNTLRNHVRIDCWRPCIITNPQQNERFVRTAAAFVVVRAVAGPAKEEHLVIGTAAYCPACTLSLDAWLCQAKGSTQCSRLSRRLWGVRWAYRRGSDLLQVLKPSTRNVKTSNPFSSAPSFSTPEVLRHPLLCSGCLALPLNKNCQ